MRSLKTLHELKESWKNSIHVEEVDKSDDENPRVPTRDLSRATEVGEEKDDVGKQNKDMFDHLCGCGFLLYVRSDQKGTVEALHPVEQMVISLPGKSL